LFYALKTAAAIMGTVICVRSIAYNVLETYIKMRSCITFGNCRKNASALNLLGT